jgi:hypothetical protein
VAFTVVDANSGRDSTSTVLAQIILDQERTQEEVVYPAHLLRRLICRSDKSLARFAHEHLPRLLDLHQASECTASELLDRAVLSPGQEGSPEFMAELRSIHGRLDTLLNALEPTGASSCR